MPNSKQNMRSQKEKQISSYNGVTTSTTPVSNSLLPGFQILNDLSDLLNKYRDGQAECLGGSAVVQNAPGSDRVFTKIKQANISYINMTNQSNTN